ncbi:TPA: ATP-binding cassette domain-containing protein [Escherichia coli]|uniref:ATP-binding cassette domain-containing protein n=1 Tax=Escherichia coli TaxID=562 RepID=UPI000945A175|nr:ATP-binding cassette domain-containing protein [Escherichia coli]EHM8973089.1 ATP-binding cassette domain-containing protein [Escherichia coli]OKV26282.1 macrolide ABC transporter ATP-binding protein [Escherichia coli]OKX69627.1 macrolide ABC transporter ATP-binding protein [Escherichia coli]VUW92078.1 Lipoprotein-releasing system ATP-binding protein LolD [Escherichia fergusonii]
MIDLYVKSKFFSDRKILDNLNIHLSPGDFLVLTGPSGAGKSTLLNIIGMLDVDFLGDYFFYGEKVNLRDTRILSGLREKHFGYIFQDSLINEKQSITRNLLCSVDYSKQNKVKGKIIELLDAVGLHDISRPTSVLSGGEKQRLALARALIKEPDILLADEPTASLDKINKKKVMNILNVFRSSGGIVVMVTHDIDLVSSDMTTLNVSSYE